MGRTADLSFLDDHTVHVENEFVDLNIRALPEPLDNSRYLQLMRACALNSCVGSCMGHVVTWCRHVVCLHFMCAGMCCARGAVLPACALHALMLHVLIRLWLLRRACAAWA